MSLEEINTRKINFKYRELVLTFILYKNKGYDKLRH